jgi:hypothetical protein
VIIEPSFEENRITDDSRAAAYSGNAGKDAYIRLSLHTMLNFRTPRLWLAGAEVGEAYHNESANSGITHMIVLTENLTEAFVLCQTATNDVYNIQMNR